MKGLLVNGVIFLLCLVSLAFANPGGTDVVISEVLYNAQGDESGKEWIELYNPTSSDVNISQWSLWRKGTLAPTHIITFPLGSKIKSQGYLLIGDDGTLPPGLNPDFIGSVSPLTNTGNGILLKDNLNQSIDTVGWRSVSDAQLYEGDPFSVIVGDGNSIERILLLNCSMQDTDNNLADFIDQSTPTPRNSSFFCDPDNDGDGFTASIDCDDNNASMHPAATELCNGADDDCDGAIDEGFDIDNDGIANCFDNCLTVYNPIQADSDGDEVGGACDKCPNSMLGEEVDENGCDPFQFCEPFYCGLGCFYADWKNNEAARFPHDCTVVIVLRGGGYEPKCVPLSCCD